ncbi:MAG: hypothetical protein ACPGES_11375 [Coraliomargarita sp.]
MSITTADVNKERELQDILRKHADAMGGLRNWNKIESIRTTGTIERNGQLVDFCIIKKRPNQIRATITMPIPGNEEQFVQVIRAHDGNEAWTATRLAGGETLAQKTLTGDEASDLIDEAQVLPQLINLWQNNANFELAGVKSYGGDVHHIIQAAYKHAPDKSYEFHVSKSSFLVSKSITYKNDQITSTATLSNLTPISGITVAKTLQLNSPATGPSLMQIEDVTVGVGIYKEYFEGSPLELSATR